MAQEKPLKATIIAKGLEITVYSTGDNDPDYKLVEFGQFKKKDCKERGGKK
jgi:hypothetical protein